MRYGISVNYHLWPYCNYRCQYCFATFEDIAKQNKEKRFLPKEEALALIKILADAGCKKITFAGGEPTLYPWISELIMCAKISGLKTMIVTNGSRLNDDFLSKNKPYLDWIAVSIDSVSQITNKGIGRCGPCSNPWGEIEYLALVDKIKFYGYRLKINTVVSAANYNEDMTGFINKARPERWKILQTLPVVGQNDVKVDPFLIGAEQFRYFLSLNANLLPGIIPVPEPCDAITGSYLMIDPIGRFFDDTKGTHTYSSEILHVGLAKALSEISFDFQKYLDRGADYEF